MKLRQFKSEKCTVYKFTVYGGKKTLRPYTVHRKPLTTVLLFLALASSLSGCGATYSRNQFIPAVKQLCQQEYGLDVSVQIVGRTLGVYLPLDKLLDSTLQIPLEARKKLADVVLATSRVVLSTYLPLDFYVVVAQDQRILGTELRLTRYIPDIRRFSYGDLSHGEFSQRMLFDIDLGFTDLLGKKDPTFRLEEVKLPNFLAGQIARRIETKFKEDPPLKERFELKASQSRFSPYRAQTEGWGLSKGRYGDFIFALDVKSRGLGLATALSEEDVKEIYNTALALIAAVLHSYQFEAFDTVEIHVIGTEHPLILDRELLELYRRKKVRLNDLLTPNHFNLSSPDPQPLFNQ